VRACQGGPQCRLLVFDKDCVPTCVCLCASTGGGGAAMPNCQKARLGVIVLSGSRNHNVTLRKGECACSNPKPKRHNVSA